MQRREGGVWGSTEWNGKLGGGEEGGQQRIVPTIQRLRRETVRPNKVVATPSKRLREIVRRKGRIEIDKEI